MAETKLIRQTPYIPLYSQARSFLGILDPEMWIPERLGGSERELAERIWRESKQNLNPRYIRGCWDLATKHDLLVRNQADILTMTERGRRFLDEIDRGVSVQIDTVEGILEILCTVAEKGPGRRSEFLDGSPVGFSKRHLSVGLYPSH
jgi:hypothetical protein